MTHARLGLGAIVLLFAIAGCAPVEPDFEATSEALTVCHSTVLEGVDVASFQGSIDWNAVHGSGRDFAIARIGDGTYSDPTFHTNYDGIHAAGMVRGAYLFWRPHLDAATEAAAILDAIGTLAPGDLPPTIDVECMCPFHSGGGCGVSSYSDCVSTATASSRLTDLVNMITAATGRPPMIYTGTWFWDGGTYLNSASSFPSSPLWVSGYTSGCVSVPSGWTDWQIWQYSDGTCSGCVGGAIPGISGAGVDRDRWNGDLASLMAFTGGGHPIYGAHYVMQSFPLASDGPLQIMQGDSVSAWIELRNTGTADWDENTRLGTTVARDRTDTFVGADWISPNRLASVPAGMTIPPGSSYRFMWTFTVPPGTPLGMYDEHFGVVEEGTAWFGDPGQGGPSDDTIEVIIEVTQGPDAGMPPPPVDAAMPPGDGGMTVMHDGGGTTPGEDAGGVVMSRGIAGGCGCAAIGERSGDGAGLCLIVLGALVTRRRRARSRR
jgi:lysozyme